MCRSCSAVTNGDAPRAISRSLDNVNCLKTLSYYQEIDTSEWDLYHRAIVRAQISNYTKKCNLHHDFILSLQVAYGQIPPGEGE